MIARHLKPILCFITVFIAMQWSASNKEAIKIELFACSSVYFLCEMKMVMLLGNRLKIEKMDVCPAAAAAEICAH
jgi:hypothetical protein